MKSTFLKKTKCRHCVISHSHENYPAKNGSVLNAITTVIHPKIVGKNSRQGRLLNRYQMLKLEFQNTKY